MQIYEDRYGWMDLVFDDVSEKRAVEEMIKFLREGMPETRIANKVPDFLPVVFYRYSY
ncbi:MAG: hypothetical protein WC784_00625 [Candidatus Shapirobacteria bacterium]